MKQVQETVCSRFLSTHEHCDNSTCGSGSLILTTIFCNQPPHIYVSGVDKLLVLETNYEGTLY